MKKRDRISRASVLGSMAILFAVNVSAAPPTIHQTTTLHIADFILSLQNTDGAVADAPGSRIANEDSNMEYALMGLAAAYRQSGDMRYLNGLEKGIRWLARRENKSRTKWRGSWYYAYRAFLPYNHLALSPGPGVADVRGVSATSALFAYLLYLHAHVSGTEALAAEFKSHARAALDFILGQNRSTDGFFYNSWQKKKNGTTWKLWRFQYSADQADAYLGLRAGWLLYHDSRFGQAADRIAALLGPSFFLENEVRYALGRDRFRSLDPDMEGFNGIFPQGYIPWVLGAGNENSAAFQWLSQCRQPDGSLICASEKAPYALSAAIYVLAASSLSEPLPLSSLDWILGSACDPNDGGVRDTSDPAAEKYSNVAGFTVLALLQFPPF